MTVDLIYEYRTFLKRYRKGEVLDYYASHGVHMPIQQFLNLFNIYRSININYGKKENESSILSIDYGGIIFFATAAACCAMEVAKDMDTLKILGRSTKHYHSIDREKHIICIAKEFLALIDKWYVKSFSISGIEVETVWLYNNFYPNVEVSEYDDNHESFEVHKAAYKEIEFYSIEKEIL